MKTEIFTSAVFLVTFAAGFPAVTPDPAEPNTAINLFVPEAADPLIAFLSVLESIPDSILAAGDEATNDWLVAQDLREAGAALRPERDGIPDTTTIVAEVKARDVGRVALVARAGLWKVAKCAAAIIELIATTAVPAAKILRIKTYISALGGVKDAAKFLVGGSSNAEKLKVGGKDLVNLSTELSGIASIKRNCF